jgi:hypothetical protein
MAYHLTAHDGSAARLKSSEVNYHICPANQPFKKGGLTPAFFILDIRHWIVDYFAVVVTLLSTGGC